jgi:DNA adenine methylase
VSDLRAPFPWFGGKSRAASLIWRAFGDVPNYVEPFAGSLATLLARPGGPGKVETANDKDGLIANFWRATRTSPDEVARWADWPVNEADLHARHLWLVAQVPSLLDKLIADPEYSDPKIAGWWVWGICTWIGNGWCHPDVRLKRRMPSLGNARGKGVLVAGYRSLPAIGAPGHGVHAPSRKKPLTHRGKGVHRSGVTSIPELFSLLAERLRGVRICCGDWMRVLGRSTLGIDTAHGMTPCGVLLDPPYSHDIRRKQLYAEDGATVAADAARWARENGDNPTLRIALCGLVGEHEMPGWTSIAWKSTSASRTRAMERIWFSPHCLPVEGQRDLFTRTT